MSKLCVHWWTAHFLVNEFKLWWSESKLYHYCNCMMCHREGWRTETVFICKVCMSWCNRAAHFNRMCDDCDRQNIGSSHSAEHLFQNQNISLVLDRFLFPNIAHFSLKHFKCVYASSLNVKFCLLVCLLLTEAHVEEEATGNRSLNHTHVRFDWFSGSL